jgi:hypothetical protein
MRFNADDRLVVPCYETRMPDDRVPLLVRVAVQKPKNTPPELPEFDPSSETASEKISPAATVWATSSLLTAAGGDPTSDESSDR